MNNNLLQELDAHYNAFVNLRDLKDYNEFCSSVISYFNFIESTYPFSEIARTFFSSHSNLIVLKQLKSIYQEVISNKSGCDFSGSLTMRIPGVDIFHKYLVENGKQSGLIDKRVILLHKEWGSNRICLLGEVLKCYTMKGTAPDRFRIVLMLFETENGKSASEIADSLGKDGTDKTVQDNTKKEIRKINILFSKDCEISDELILYTEIGGKNIYFLNREQFFFEEKK